MHGMRAARPGLGSSGLGFVTCSCCVAVVWECATTMPKPPPS